MTSDKFAQDYFELMQLQAQADRQAQARAERQAKTTARRNSLMSSLKRAVPGSVNEFVDDHSFTLDYVRTSAYDSGLASDVDEWKQEHADEIERVKINHVGGSTYVRVIVADEVFAAS